MSLVTMVFSCHGFRRNNVNEPRHLAEWLLQEGKTMESYLEQYEAKEERVTLHTWTDVQGANKENFYITGMPGTPIPWWFRKVLRQKHLADLACFPHTPSCFYV
jgi:hypothetical protein